jgi:hypothetical protein
MREGLRCVLLVAFAFGCGGSSDGSFTPAAPTPAAPPPSWTLSGVVTNAATGQPVAGAAIAAGSFNVTTDNAGRFTLTNVAAPSANLHATVTSDSYLTRETSIAWPRTGSLTIDVIPQAAPFDLMFYRALVRNGNEAGASSLQPLRRWTRDATFYVHTIDDKGRTLEPEVLALLRAELPRAFRAWTHGRYSANVEDGTEPRAAQTGLIRVNLIRQLGESFCGNATVGGDVGTITFNVDNCSRGSLKIPADTVWHEVGHAAGFWHVPGRDAVMSITRNARGLLVGNASEQELYHADIAYRRAPGNLDVDRDATSFSLLTAPGTPAPPPAAITCRRGA